MKIDLTNKWMNDATVLAQIGHVLGGYSLVMTTAYLSNNSHAWTLFFAALLVAYAGVKEFWYDAKYEIPVQTWKDNLLDFSMYVVGLIVGLTVVFLIKR